MDTLLSPLGLSTLALLLFACFVWPRILGRRGRRSAGELNLWYDSPRCPSCHTQPSWQILTIEQVRVCGHCGGAVHLMTGDLVERK